MDYRTNVEGAIANLYDTFAHYPLRPVVSGCPCCTTLSNNVLLHSKALDKLTAKDLSKYSFKALTTWGDENDFRYFLPRLLELITFDTNDELAYPEIVLGKLRYAGYQAWDAQEQQAVHMFLFAFWQYKLNELPCEQNLYSSTAECENWLCAVAQAEDVLQPYLQAWLTMPTVPPALHLAQFVNANYLGIASFRQLNNPFWEERPEQVRQVITWLLESQTVTYLESTFFQNVDAIFSDSLALAVDLLTQLRSQTVNAGQATR
jgi:hypothetical protein